MSTTDLSGLTWQQKVKALHAERVEQEKLRSLNGLFIYNAAKYRDLAQAAKYEVLERIAEPYWGGEFESASRVFDVLGVVWQAARVAGTDIKAFFVVDGKVFAEEDGYEPLDEDTLEAYLNS